MGNETGCVFYSGFTGAFDDHQPAGNFFPFFILLPLNLLPLHTPCPPEERVI